MIKKGLSGTISIVLIILLGMAAVAIMWVFLAPLLSEAGQGINSDILTVRMSINGEVQWDPDNRVVNFNAKREVGEGSVVGVRAVVIDSEGRAFSHVEPGELDELESAAISIDYSTSDLGDTIDSVEIYPILSDESGNEISGNLADSYEFIGDEGGEPGRQEYLIFVTSDTMQGDFGGIGQANQICQAAAARNPGLDGKNWAAWLSDSSNDARDLVQPLEQDKPYRLVTGDLVANDWNDLFTLKGNDYLRNIINFDESGNDVGGIRVWTGTDEMGVLDNGGEICSEWSLTSGDGVRGRTGRTNSEWTVSGSNSCTNQYALFCFEVD